MLRTLCKSKIHGATVTEANLQYTDSLTIDPWLMRSADLVPYEQVHVVNINNGARLETYCSEGRPGSGTVCMNGAAARWAAVGDKVIIISYTHADEREVQDHVPRLVFVDEQNHVAQIQQAEATP